MEKKKILVVDDEDDIRHVLRIRLEAHHYDVVEAMDGNQAMECVKTEKPDLIVLDVMMPAPNGYQVCRMIKDDPNSQSIKVILLTAKGSDSDKFWGGESGADVFITKPYNAPDLVAKIQELLAED